MMARKLFERCRVIEFGIFLLFSQGCATASSNLSQPTKVEGKFLPLNVQAELSSSSIVSGTIALITLQLPRENLGKVIEGEFEGENFPFFPATLDSDPNKPLAFQGVLAIPYERKPGPGVVTVSISKDTQKDSFPLNISVIDGNYPSEKLHVDGKRVNLMSASDLVRIKKEQAEVAEIYKQVTPQKMWKGPFVFPIESSVTSPFGSRRVYNGQLKNFHPGLDLKAPMKTPIRAPAPGVVVMAKNLFYTGNTVMLDHGYGVITLYAHMTELKVKKGQSVDTRDLLGLSGMTGRVTGPHLHWQAVIHRIKVNPMGLIQVMR